MAFFSTAGIERLCSGVTNSNGVGSLDLRLEAGDGGGDRLLMVLIVHRQVVDLDEVGLEGVAAQLASACASLRLMDSRRLLPTTMPILSFAMGASICGYDLLPRLDR